MPDNLIVLAIDFGTTYSGYAFSFKSDPTRIHTNQVSRVVYIPALSCLVLWPQSRFVSATVFLVAILLFSKTWLFV